MENQTPTVSCYLSTYNQAPYVAQAIDSILMQKTNFSYELLIADDCSTDGTQEIIKNYAERYPDKIKLFISSENYGATKKSSIALSMLTGKYYAPLEGDDYWLNENRLQILIDFLEQHPECVGVSHVRERRNIQGKLIGHDPAPEILNKYFTIQDFLDGKRYSAVGTVYRNFWPESSGKYEALMTLRRNVSDYQFMFIPQDFGKIFVLDNCLGVYRARKDPKEYNYNSITKRLTAFEDHLAIIQAVHKFYNGKYDLQPELARLKASFLMASMKNLDKEALAYIGRNFTAYDYLTSAYAIPGVISRKLRKY